jgi:hypothetical protein
LPECPLAYVFGIDPLKHYPWDLLCKYRSLRYQPQCNFQLLNNNVNNDNNNNNNNQLISNLQVDNISNNNYPLNDNNNNNHPLNNNNNYVQFEDDDDIDNDIENPENPENPEKTGKQMKLNLEDDDLYQYIRQLGDEQETEK